MFIRNIRLQNFKCFQNVDTALSRITLLTGANSSGKSSLMYGILAPLQSDGFPFYLSPNGKYVDLGDYKEMVFRGSGRRRISVEIDMGVEQSDEPSHLRTEWALDRHTTMPVLSFASGTTTFTTFELKAQEDGAYTLRLDYDPSRMIHKKEQRVVAGMLESAMELITSELPAAEKRKIQKGPFRILDPLKFKSRRMRSLDEARTWIPLLDPFIRNDMKRYVNFISSFRLQPDRTYYQLSQFTGQVGKYGDHHISQILEWEKRKSPEFDQMNSTLAKVGLLTSMKSKQLPGGRIELRVKVQRTGVWSLLTDVGFGISQFLPIVVAELQLPPGSTLFIAQPEIHLHPAVQAALADYFIEKVTTKNMRFVIETHSEYLLNRFRLAIARERLRADDVAAYYFENGGQGARQYALEFRKDGQIAGAPKGFFDTYMLDVMKIAMDA